MNASNFMNITFLKFSEHGMNNQETEIEVTILSVVHAVYPPQELYGIHPEIPGAAKSKNGTPAHCCERLVPTETNPNSVPISTTFLGKISIYFLD